MSCIHAHENKIIQIPPHLELCHTKTIVPPIIFCDTMVNAEGLVTLVILN